LGAGRQIEIGYGNDQVFRFALGLVQKDGFELRASGFEQSFQRVCSTLFGERSISWTPGDDASMK
jgi:hypothetical protein